MDTGKDERPSEWLAVTATLISVALVLAFNYVYIIDGPNLQSRLKLHTEIVTGTSEDLFASRILVPYTMELVIRGLSGGMSREGAFVLGYACFDFAGFFYSLWALYWYVRIWFTRDQALSGVLFVAAVMPLTFRNHYFHPWSIVELGFFAHAFRCMHAGSTAAVAGLVVLATLNRPTAMLLPFAYVLVNRGSRAGSALVCAAWAVPFALVMYFCRGTKPNVIHSSWDVFQTNLSQGQDVLWRFVLFAGAYWIFALDGVRRAPAFVRKTAVIVPIHLAMFSLTYWIEIRNLIVDFAVLVPLALSCLHAPRDE